MPVIVASLCRHRGSGFFIVMPDGDEAGYAYNDLCHLMGEDKVLFFPSSYKRAVKYGQHDAQTRYCARRHSPSSLRKRRGKMPGRRATP